jgi:hypothetical protein
MEDKIIYPNDQIHVINGKSYEFLTNFDEKFEKHMIAVLSLAKIDDYFVETEVYDIIGNPLEETQRAIWISQEYHDKRELFFQTSLVLRGRIKKELIEHDYDVSDITLSDIHYGMDIKSLSKK